METIYISFYNFNSLLIIGLRQANCIQNKQKQIKILMQQSKNSPRNRIYFISKFRMGMELMGIKLLNFSKKSYLHLLNSILINIFLQKSYKILKVISNYKLDYFMKSSILNTIFRQSFERANKELYYSGIDITFSGATTVALLFIDNVIWCANIGDSRAVKRRESSVYF